MKNFSALQNGSDIRGIALAGISGENVNIDEEALGCIAAGFAQFLSARTGKRISGLNVSIGMDSRLSGPSLKKAAIETLISMGCNVGDLGLASTPALFMSTITDGYLFDGAIMLTASHLPWNRNGLKFFTASGGVEKNEVTRILELASTYSKSDSPQPGKVSELAFMKVYAQQLVQKIRLGTEMEKPLEDLKIIVDAGNGAGGFFASDVLMPLGANISGSQFLNPDGNFPNHIPNPENQEAMDSVINAVLVNKADLGIIFDTDVDRAALVGADGTQINRNRLVALMSAIVLEEHPGTTIVTDSITSDGLGSFISNKLGGKHHRFKRGYKNVINESLRLNKAGSESWLAIETSGHAAMKENYFLDDGAYLISKLLIKVSTLRKNEGKHLSYLLSGLQEPAEDQEFRFNIKLSEFSDYGKKVLDALPAFIDSMNGWSQVVDNYEGIRVSCSPNSGDGWFLLRMSLHDPVMPLNIESNSAGGSKIIAQKLKPFFMNFTMLEAERYYGFLSS
jgi:phosphomannomutase